MRAQILRSFGQQARFELVDVEEPVARVGEVLIGIRATSINPIDCKLRRHGGEVAPVLPAILGSDIAGHVIEVGSGVSHFAVGDAVFGYIGGVRGSPGAYAERAAVDARLVARAPQSIPLEHAAALPLPGLTALDGLERSGVSSGSSVLIVGANGGVGNLAVQLAKAMGATVHAAVHAEAGLSLAYDNGADDAFLPIAGTLAEEARLRTAGAGYRLVFDCTNGIDLPELFGAAGQGGHVVTLVTRRQSDLGLLSKQGLSLHAVFVPGAVLGGVGRDQYGPRLERLAELVDAGFVKPRIHKQTFALDELGVAHDLFESGRLDGKIIILCDA